MTSRRRGSPWPRAPGPCCAARRGAAPCQRRHPAWAAPATGTRSAQASATRQGGVAEAASTARPLSWEAWARRWALRFGRRAAPLLMRRSQGRRRWLGRPRSCSHKQGRSGGRATTGPSCPPTAQRRYMGLSACVRDHGAVRRRALPRAAARRRAPPAVLSVASQGRRRESHVK